ncbi:metallophosphoesterase [Colwellia sp. MEBiC06753]
MIKPINVVQFSDCHLFADKNAEHHGANVYQNLARVCADIAKQEHIDLAVFTGDLTQDHSEDSYQVFAEVVIKHLSHTQVAFLAGNHDDPNLLRQHLSVAPFIQKNSVAIGPWCFHLFATKSETPAGIADIEGINQIIAEENPQQFHFAFMHHHPVDVGYFIDRHGLINQQEFWAALNQWSSLKGLACGHIHRGLNLIKKLSGRNLPVYSCPATSIKFAQHPQQLIAESTEPSYRLFQFQPDGEITSQIIQL